ncbi:MAG: BON domain-containing protein [Pseudomonadales bacterium]|nr:BON domain-containing protein [Pseudomonadales bacterium]
MQVTFSILKATLVTLLLITPPISDAVEQRSIPLAHEKDRELLKIVSENWRKGTIDAAFLLNKNLESRSIHVSVDADTAVLTGEVNSAVKKSLAQEIALSVDGIKKVNNQLNVIANQNNEIINSKAIIQDKADVVLTSKINQRLLTHKHLRSAVINVHSKKGMVELSGKTPSESVKDLAYYLAKNVNGVKSVDNQLRVSGHL